MAKAQSHRALILPASTKVNINKAAAAATKLHLLEQSKSQKTDKFDPKTAPLTPLSEKETPGTVNPQFIASQISNITRLSAGNGIVEKPAIIQP